MSKNNFEVGLVNYACPICGNVTDSAIIMNNKLTEKEAKKIRETHNKTIGWSKNACDKCTVHKDDCIYVIEIDTDKSNPDNPYRTGMYWGIRKDFPLFVNHPEYILKTKNGVQYCFIDKELAEKMGFPHENN